VLYQAEPRPDARQTGEREANRFQGPLLVYTGLRGRAHTGKGSAVRAITVVIPTDDASVPDRDTANRLTSRPGLQSEHQPISCSTLSDIASLESISLSGPDSHPHSIENKPSNQSNPLGRFVTYAD
jgi:hypothetical protein